jgi:hypothetical protein
VNNSSLIIKNKMATGKSEECVKVMVRVRPMNSSEKQKSNNEI